MSYKLLQSKMLNRESRHFVMKMLNLRLSFVVQSIHIQDIASQSQTTGIHSFSLMIHSSERYHLKTSRKYLIRQVTSQISAKKSLAYQAISQALNINHSELHQPNQQIITMMLTLIISTRKLLKISKPNFSNIAVRTMILRWQLREA